jgi:hypothetical protein
MRGQFFQTFKGNLNIDEINDSRRAKTIDNMDVDFINKIKGYTLKIADNSGPEKHVDDYKKYFDYYVGNALMKEDTKADIRMRIGIIEKMAQKTPETEGGRIYKIKTNALALFDILYILVPRDNDPLVDYISKPNYGGRKPKSKPKKRK